MKKITLFHKHAFKTCFVSKAKLLLMTLVLTLTASAQQVYYNVPGVIFNGVNTGEIRDLIASGTTLYVCARGYSNTGFTPVNSTILALDTNQSTPIEQEIYVATSPSALNLAINQNTLRFNGASSNVNFYDLDLNQTLPTTPTITSGISVNGFFSHVFYQNNFIYGSNISGSSNFELFLPLQTLTLSAALWDVEIYGDTLFYTAGDNTNLYSIDLTSSSATPQIVHTDSDAIVAIDVSSNYIHYGTYQGAKIKRLDRNTNAVITLATIPSSGNANTDYPRSVEVIGNQVFFAAFTDKLYVITDNTLITNDFNIDIFNTKIYPNPVQNQLHIQTESKPKNYTVFSVLGKEIITSEFNASLDVSQLKAGIYFIKINSENGSVTKRFIKQ